MNVPFQHIHDVAKIQQKKNNELELWTTLAAGNFAPRVDFPAAYSGRVYWEFNGILYPATSGATISAPAVGGMQRATLKGVPLSQLTRLDANSTGLVGDIMNLRPDRFRAMQYLRLYNTSVSGDIASLAGLSKLANLRLDATSATCGSTFTASWVGMRDFQVQNCLMSQAAVGNIVESIWNARAGFTYATPALNVGGTNAAPAGNVIAPIEGADWHDDRGTWIPLTTGAMIWDLAKDVNLEGFKKWTVTYNGGVASP